MNLSEYFLVSFSVYCNLTRDNETVKVTGNCPQLGNWSAHNALTLSSQPENFPTWSGGVMIPKDVFKTDQKLEYKYIITNHKRPDEVLWEQFHGNRTTLIKHQLELKDIFNDPNLQFLNILAQNQRII